MGEKMDELDRWMDEHEPDFRKDIRSLVEIPSVAVRQPGTEAGMPPYGEACARALDQMLELGAGYGFLTDNCDGYCGSISFGEGDRTIGIWGHLDVVKAGEGWTYPSFSCTEKGDFIIGRGVQDNKGPLVAVLYAMRYLKEKRHLNSRILLIFGCNEENEMDDIQYYMNHRKAPDLSFVADCSFPVCRGEKGICRLTIKSGQLHGNILSMEAGTALNIVPSRAEAELRVSGRGEALEIRASGISGHAAFPENTRNAVGSLAKKLKELLADEEEIRAMEFLERACGDGYGKGLDIACEDEDSGALTCNLGQLSMKDGVITAGLDLRYPVTVPLETILKRLKDTLEKYYFTVTDIRDNPPYCVDRDHPLVRNLMEAYGEETGSQPEAYLMGGGTYARKIPNAVGFGPGFPADLRELGLPAGHGGCHGADEAQSMTGLKKAMRIYVKAIEKLAAARTGHL